MSTKLVVLGLLMEGNKHPYEMQQSIRQREMDRYIKLQKGSLYYTVEQLVKEGLIEVESIVKETNHPDKTVYKITEAGRNEFHDLLLKILTKPQNIFHPLNCAIAFIKHVEKNELISALESRIRTVELTISECKAAYKKHESHIPKYGLRIMESGIEFNILELKLLRSILEDAENGSLIDYASLESFSI